MFWIGFCILLGAAVICGMMYMVGYEIAKAMIVQNTLTNKLINEVINTKLAVNLLTEATNEQVIEIRDLSNFYRRNTKEVTTL